MPGGQLRLPRQMFRPIWPLVPPWRNWPAFALLLLIECAARRPVHSKRIKFGVDEALNNPGHPLLRIFMQEKGHAGDRSRVVKVYAAPVPQY